MSSTWFIRRIMQSSLSADHSWTCAMVADFFSRNKEVDILPVLHNEMVAGIVYRMDFFNKYFRKFGPEVFGGEPVATMMDAKPLIVEHEALINDISLWISKNRPELFHRGFAVACEQRFQGVVSGLALVQAASEQLEETVAKLNQTRDDLIESEKMASLGGLVAGVAHELNTPIGNAVLSASSFQQRIKELRGQAEKGQLTKTSFDQFISESSELADLIYRQCQRAGHLIASFKRVAVDQTSEQRRNFTLRDLIEDHIAALGPSMKNSPWEIKLEIDASIGCDSYPGPLGQVIDNLIQNATIHAFAGRESGSLLIHAQSRNGMVDLSFQDDGVGIADADLKRIFDPFFTTRLGQGGSGLGLFVSQNIVTGLLGGMLKVSSEPGKGSCFLVRLPLVAPGAVEVA
ncbi:MAG: hypothetical protein RL748_1338 [Pseudomonadota bacterium]